MIDYAPADKYCWINVGDTILKPFALQLPNPPANHLIAGYNKKPQHNWFEREKTPSKILQIEKRARRMTDELRKKNSSKTVNGFHEQDFFWQIMEEEKESLQEEIKWIKRVRWHLRYGYFFMCYDPVLKKSKPVWITPWHYFYLNFYYISEANSYPDYRDADRRAEILAWYAYTGTDTFKNRDEKTGKALDNEIIDVGHRLYYGPIEPKRRRKGATARALAHGLWILMHSRESVCTIISDTGAHAKETFKKKLAPAWQRIPIWLKPIWDGDYRPDAAINLELPKTASARDCLYSQFNYTESSTADALDFGKYVFILADEQGKGAARAKVDVRADRNKLTLAQGQDIHGYMDNPSTVELIQEGVSEYKFMFDRSDIYTRNALGQTLYGFIALFFKTSDGYDGYVDSWGWSVHNTPLDEQIEYAKIRKDKKYFFTETKKGAKQILTEKYEQYLNSDNPNDVEKYRELLRREPEDSSDCWKGSSGGMGYNILILDKALKDCLKYDVWPYKMEWKKGIRDTEVVLKEDQNGRFMISDKLIGRCNQWKYGVTKHFDEKLQMYVKGKMPFNPLITSGGFDSFEWRTSSDMKSAITGSTNLSDGGGAVLLNYDATKDAGVDEENWTTQRFICTYRARPQLSDYLEDMLMMAVYYGCMMNGERKPTNLIEHFINRGYAGYLVYILDIDGKKKPSPCIYSGAETKQDMLSYTADHIEHHGHRERHKDLLTEWKDISNPEQLKHFDLMAAAGWCLYGYWKGNQKRIERINNPVKIDLSASWLKPA